MGYGTAAPRRVKTGAAALAIAAASILVAACTGSAPPAAAAAASAKTAKPAEITLTPVRSAGPALLAATAGVLRRRLARLGLRDMDVAVAGRAIALTGPEPGRSALASLATVGMRPVLLSSSAGSAAGSPAGPVDDSWKATVGYTAAAAQWNAPGRPIVSCDASGDKYVLGSAVVLGPQVTSAFAGQQASIARWIVDLALDGAASKAFGAFTQRQYSAYATGAQAGNANDAVLDSTAIVLDGNVLAAPVTAGPITTGLIQVSGSPPAGFSQATAQVLAALLGSGPLPVGLKVAAVRVLGRSAA